MNGSQKGLQRDGKIEIEREREEERGKERMERGKKVARTPVARQRLSISVSPHVLEAFAYTGCILVTSRFLSYTHTIIANVHTVYKVLRKYFDKIFGKFNIQFFSLTILKKKSTINLDNLNK